MGRRSKSLVFTVSLVGLVAILFAAQPVAASHWCMPATINYGPVSGYVGDTTQFSYVLHDNVADALTVNHFYVTYSWSSTQWDLGTASIPGLSSYTFTQSTVLPSSAGSDTIT